jgi:tetratricopeptide (TPR) repeat protein
VRLTPLSSLVRDLARALGGIRLGGRPPATPGEDADVSALLARARAAQDARRPEEALRAFREVLDRQRGHVDALRGMREVAVSAGRWSDAREAQERLLSLVPGADRAAEGEWLAVIHYELGRADAAAGRADGAIEHFRQAVRAHRPFTPAVAALGDAHEAAGDRREAVRVWERAADVAPSLPVLGRLERVYRQDGRPSRMIALYRAAVERAPGDLGLAAALGRVYLELEMLAEAADQFEKLEMRAPDLPVVHAFLGAVFERRGDTREALDEYRKALRLADAFGWPHRCAACAAVASTWVDRCRACGRWNTLQPVDRR